MNKWLGGGAALGFAALGTLALAGPGSAQADPLQATIEPSSVPQGGTVTLTSVDACVDGASVPGNLVVDIFFEDEADPFQSDPFDLLEGADPADVAQIESPDGQWAIDYEGAPDEAVGTYTYVVTCLADDGTELGTYVSLSAETVAGSDPSTPPTAPPAAPPATPVDREPGFTG